MSSDWIIVGIVLSAIYLPILYFGVGRFLKPLARTTLIVLTLFELCLVFAHLIVYANNISGFSEWFFGLGSEYGLGATYSAAQLLAVGLIAFLVARFAAFTPAQRLYWIMLGFLFTFLNLDEYYVLHDAIDEKIFAGLAAVGMVIILGGYWINFRRERVLFGLLFGGLVIVGLALGSDAVLPNVPQQSALEEFMEMNGITWILVGFLSYAQSNLPQNNFRWIKRIALVIPILWALFLFAMFWIFPTIEYKLFAQPVQITYLDGDLELVGYRLNREKAAPGDTVDLTLYWRTTRPIPQNYGASTHLLTHPDVQSVFQADNLLILYYQTNSWIPGVITRLPVTLRIPDDSSTPLSYWLQITVFSVEGYEATTVTANSVGQLITPESLVLLGFPVVEEQSIPESFIDTAYDFGGQFELAGYTMPESATAGASVPLQFHWQTGEHDISEKFTQFIHIFKDDTFIAGFDQQPFDTRYPTSDWATHSQFTDTRNIDLPDDLSEGDYDIYTGMYNAANQQRLPIMDGDTTMPDGLIHLGSLQVD